MISATFDLSICRRKLFKVDFIDISKRELMPAILFCFDHALFHPQGVNNTQLLLGSEPIRLLEIPRALSEYTPFKAILLRIILYRRINVHCLITQQVVLYQVTAFQLWWKFFLQMKPLTRNLSSSCKSYIFRYGDYFSACKKCTDN